MLMSMSADFLINDSGWSFFDDAVQNGHKNVAMAVVTHDRWPHLIQPDAFGVFCNSLRLKF